MKKIFYTTLFLLCFTPAVSFAANIFFEADKTSFDLEEEFLVEVFLDTKGQIVNALEGKVLFPAGLLELKEVRDGNSSINFWIEKPHSERDGEILLSGTTPGGFSGPNIFLFGMVLQSQRAGSGSITLTNMQVLENDGLGTKVSVKTTPFKFSISSESDTGAPENLAITDTDPPESFSPFVANDPVIFGDQLFLVFSTVDKGTGVDHYEVLESPWFLFGLGGEYVVAESPYLLEDQTLKSRIYIKAVDKALNVRVVKLGAQNKLGLLEQFLILAILLAVAIFFIKKIWQKLTL